MTTQQKFFYEHAGYSVAPGETKRQGKLRSAKALAAAKTYAREQGWTYAWEYDSDGCIGCDCGSSECDCASGADHETLGCILRDSEPSCYDSWGRPTGGAVLASLWGICGATSEYKRVVEAELALEAMPDTTPQLTKLAADRQVGETEARTEV